MSPPGDGPRAFHVRPAGREDAGLLAQVHAESIETLGALSYPAEVVAEWRRPCTPARYLEQMARGERYLLALGDGAVLDGLGFSSWRIEGGRHRTAVYVAARAARGGVGSALFRAAEGLARENGAAEVHVDASVGAVGFYRAMGFEETGRGDHVMRSGGRMACVFMRKGLPGAAPPR